MPRKCRAVLSSSALRASGERALAEGIITNRAYKIPPSRLNIEVMCNHRITVVRISPILVEYTRLMIHETLPVGMLQCNCSIFGDETTRQAMVIDPGDEIDAILQVLAKHGLTVTSIVI